MCPDSPQFVNICVAYVRKIGHDQNEWPTRRGTGGDGVPRGHNYRGDGLDVGALTRRQAEVVQLLVNGMTVKQIASCLGISKRTVTGHLSAARRRARARTSQ